MMPVIGNIARLMTRHCYVVIENRLSWDSTICLESNDFCITELNFWRQNIDLLNVKNWVVTCVRILLCFRMPVI